MTNKLLESFLADKKIKKICESYYRQPSIEKKENIELLFQKHFNKIQILSYFSKFLHFEAKRFDQKTRANQKKENLILGEQSEMSQSKVSSDEEWIEDLIKPRSYKNIELYFNKEELFQSARTLTDRQKYVLYYLYVEGLSEKEISLRLQVTKQNINNIKRTALSKLREKSKL